MAKMQVDRWLEQTKSEKPSNRRVRPAEIFPREPHEPLVSGGWTEREFQIFWLGMTFLAGGLAWGAWALLR